MKRWNKLLRRQIKRNFTSEADIPASMVDLFDAISNSFDHSDRDRKLLERAMDISSQELREKSVMLEDQLHKSNQLLENFASIVSHDLKEPLRTIGSFSQLLALRFKDELTEKDKKHFQLIGNGIHRLNLMLEDLLSFADFGKKTRDLTNIDLNGVVNSAVENLGKYIKETNTVVIASELPSIQAYTYPIQILRVFQNLINNAIKFRSAKPPEIHIRFEDEPDSYLISIKDNGIGIPEDSIEKIFNMFYRVKRGINSQGSGLGLTICKTIIENLGGRIWCENTYVDNELSGTAFFIEIPKVEKKGYIPLSRKAKVS